MGISEHLEWIMENYLDARKGEAFSSSSPVYERFREVANELSELPSIKERPTLHVSWSVGQGNWARIPWIAFLDQRETQTTQEGVYPVMLFREDMTGLYITFIQGVSELRMRHGTREMRRILRELQNCIHPGH